MSALPKVTRRKRGAGERRRHIPHQVREAVLTRDGFACTYCECPHKLTLDHKIPWSWGGSDFADNLITACKSCNSRKGDRTYWDYESSLWLLDPRPRWQP